MRPVIAALLLPALAHAAPIELAHSGRLLDAQGAAVSGPRTLTVSLFTVDEGGTAAWSDEFAVDLADGYFSVLLGSGVALDTVTHLGAPEVWVQTAVNGVATGPRTPLVRVPFAARADSLSAGATVGGALMLGDEAPGWCVAGREGGLIWDQATSTMQVCAGSAGWQTVGAVNIVESGGSRRWQDGTVAEACWAYRFPTGMYRYAGATGSGVYRVDPDGSGAIAAFDVYCDMVTDGGGWTLVDNDATNAATFTTRTTGAITDPAVSGGRFLPGYAWSSDPLLMCRSSNFTGTANWLTLSAGGAIARQYPTAATQTASHDGGWAVRTLNGNTNHGATSWIIWNGAEHRGQVWIGYGSNSTCSCNYQGIQSGLGTYGAANTSTCSTWVR